eukprot:GFUD01026630.1.p1 GENE.GFUD01026630.1~~GFUD01026630.1.p1  ORF type:complete len:254 (+),score=92.55 GFUD01026630.1:144-905(+)
MPPYCKIINFSPCSLSWLQSMILGTTGTSSNTNQWKVVTKYYKAEVMLKLIDHEDVISDEEDFSDTEAVVFCCDTTKETLDRAEKIWMKIKECSPAVCLFVVETASDDVQDKKEATRTQILDWCLSNQFELVECNEEDEDGDSDTEERFDEKAGRIRIVQALKAHTWSNLELIEESEMKDEKENEETETENNSLLVAAQENLGEDPSFEDLFSQISKMKDISNNLPDEERRAYAEKVSLAFYKSIGLDSEDEE